MPETPVWVYGLGGESLVAAEDGSRWIVGAAPEVLLGPDGADVITELAAAAPVAPPELDRDDLVLDSCEALLATANRAAQELGAPDSPPAIAAPRTAVWPFGGRWHRMRLEPGDASAAAACLRATVADPSHAETLCRPPASGPTLKTGAARLDPSPPGALTRWEPGTGTWEPHPLRPAPAVDPLTGVLRRVAARPPDPALPPGFRHLHAELPYLASVDTRFQVDALAPAGTFDEDDEAAVLSGVEHYCGAYFGQGERRLASLAELEGEQAVSIPDWEPHDPALHAEPGFPFAPFHSDSPLWWLAGEERGGRCWVPLSLVHVGWLEAGLTPAQVFHGHNFTGMKAGRTLAEAAERACAHVAAHDAVAVWWHAGREARLPPAPVPTAIQSAWGASKLGLRLLQVPSTAGIPVRLAVVDDPDRDLVSLGFAADRSGERAAELAVVEALIQHASVRDLDSPHSLIRNAEALGNGAVAGLAPYDPSRRYLDAFGPGFRGLIDPMGHVQLGLDPRVAALVRERTTPGDPQPEAPEPDSIRSALERDHRVVIVDATAERVAEAGYRVARAVAPGLARVQPAAFPLDPQARLATAASALGWTAPAETVPYPGW
ncbi:YcaO-like family protein [Glycomyces tritici]|uniref:YcaO-like family protein n=1 Tax=Glycomyces tritici TaxID=2665176 RepID=A0ABT7YSK5_9ACTN|nr:YcaO-like family protein [Glycomyces tritici]MDN3241633.1 YcaO-like family protein [Glycomyces tritici]